MHQDSHNASRQIEAIDYVTDAASNKVATVRASLKVVPVSWLESGMHIKSISAMINHLSKLAIKNKQLFRLQQSGDEFYYTGRPQSLVSNG